MESVIRIFTDKDKVFNGFILKYGFPSRIHHDQGGEFENELFARLHQLTGIDKSHTTPYHPSGNGQTERMSRTLISMLKTLEEKEKLTWKDHLDKLAFAYNVTTHKSTGYSPFFWYLAENQACQLTQCLHLLEKKG